MMRRQRLLLASFASLALVGLTGCGGGEHEDIKQWMADASKDLRGNIPGLPELKPFPIAPYSAADQADPFSAERVGVEKKEAGGKQPDLNRPKEPLESFPLESISYVGIMSKTTGTGGVSYGLVLVNGAVSYVTKGNYMGQNYGRVIDVTDTEIKLLEIVQDPTGQTRDWVEREMTLQLLEGGQTKEARK